MGWKAVKEHYRIEHLVQVVPDKGICIGSPYVHDLLTITLAGEVVPGKLGLRGNSNLERYEAEMTADPVKLRELVAAPDTFEASITVFTYDGANIIECQCEELEWPNVTHDGRMMYENTFSPDRAKVLDWAIKGARSRLEWLPQIVAEKEADLAKVQSMLKQAHDDLAALESGR